MKKSVLLIIIISLPIFSFGQDDMVKKLVAKADSIFKVYESTSNSKQKIAHLCDVIELQDSIYNLLVDSIKVMSSYEKDAKTYRFFTLMDESVFSSNFQKLDEKKLPTDLAEKYKLYLTIKELSECLFGMENKAAKAEKNSEIADADKKEYIALVLKSDIDRANKLFDKKEKMNTNSLSPKQKAFEENLSVKFNNILQKYIF